MSRRLCDRSDRTFWLYFSDQLRSMGTRSIFQEKCVICLHSSGSWYKNWVLRQLFWATFFFLSRHISSHKTFLHVPGRSGLYHGIQFHGNQPLAEMSNFHCKHMDWYHILRGPAVLGKSISHDNPQIAQPNFKSIQPVFSSFLHRQDTTCELTESWTIDLQHAFSFCRLSPPCHLAYTRFFL